MTPEFEREALKQLKRIADSMEGQKEKAKSPNMEDWNAGYAQGRKDQAKDDEVEGKDYSDETPLSADEAAEIAGLIDPDLFIASKKKEAIERKRLERIAKREANAN